jgi:P-type E1-E2 ATPase
VCPRWQVSFNRLKAEGVFCSHTRAVAAAGRINCLCFDKTGTLTEVRT